MKWRVLDHFVVVFPYFQNKTFLFIDHGGVGSDRMSDDSSKEAVSDSHPDTLTDPEFSDPPIVTSSPPQSGDEVRRDKEKVKRKKVFHFWLIIT